MTIQQMYQEVGDYRTHYNFIDAKTVSEIPMDCGHYGSYLGFKKDDSYRAFAVCEACNIAEEF